MATIPRSRSFAVAHACPHCGTGDPRLLRATDRNRAVSTRHFDYAACRNCGVIWLPDVPRDLGDYYPADYHASLAPVDLDAAVAAEGRRLKLVTRYVGPGRMIEIGPSQGVFSRAATAAGFEVTALEMDADCCAYLEREVGIRAIHTADPARAMATLAPSRVVVMWHVVEHLPDPWDVLRAVAGHLEPGGVLALATPNPRSLQARALGARWAHLDAPRHLTLIPLDVLRTAANELGLQLLSATTTDEVGLGLNRLGWERSLLSPPAMRSDPRLVHTVGKVLTATVRAWEERGMRGAAYTAVLRRRDDGAVTKISPPASQRA
jgi:SAM-dependent methyltransferase